MKSLLKNNQIKNNQLQIAFATFLFGNVPFTFADFQLRSRKKNIIADRENREELNGVKAALDQIRLDRLEGENTFDIFA